MLDQIAALFDIDPSSWEEITAGTHYRHRLRLGRSMLLHAMHVLRDAGAAHVTVACLGAPGHPNALGLYQSVGFRPFTRDANVIKPA
jgi:ribosomal protein S18 acetylase RimI-like enzyme